MVNSTPSRSVSNVSQNDTPETSTGSSYDDAYKFVINFRISNFTSLDDTVKSVPYYVDHTYWRVMAMRRHSDGKNKDSKKENLRPSDFTLGIFVHCTTDSYSDEWSVEAQACLRILNLANTGNPITRELMGHQYNVTETDWGYSAFAKWVEIVDENNGYLVDGAIQIQVEITAKKALNLMDYQTFWRKGTDLLKIAELQLERGNVDKAIEANGRSSALCGNRCRKLKAKIEEQKSRLSQVAISENIKRIESMSNSGCHELKNASTSALKQAISTSSIKKVVNKAKHFGIQMPGVRNGDARNSRRSSLQTKSNNSKDNDEEDTACTSPSCLCSLSPQSNNSSNFVNESCGYNDNLEDNTVRSAQEPLNPESSSGPQSRKSSLSVYGYPNNEYCKGDTNVSSYNSQRLEVIKQTARIEYEVYQDFTTKTILRNNINEYNGENQNNPTWMNINSLPPFTWENKGFDNQTLLSFRTNKLDKPHPMNFLTPVNFQMNNCSRIQIEEKDMAPTTSRYMENVIYNNDHNYEWWPEVPEGQTFEAYHKIPRSLCIDERVKEQEDMAKLSEFLKKNMIGMWKSRHPDLNQKGKNFFKLLADLDTKMSKFRCDPSEEDIKSMVENKQSFEETINHAFIEACHLLNANTNDTVKRNMFGKEKDNYVDEDCFDDKYLNSESSFMLVPARICDILAHLYSRWKWIEVVYIKKCSLANDVNEELHKDLRDTVIEKKKLSEEIAALSSENASVKEMIKSLKTECKILTEKCKVNETAIESNRTTNALYKNVLKEYNGYKKTSEEEVAKLKREIQSINDLKKKFQTDYNSLQESYKNLQKLAEERNNLVKKLEKQLNDQKKANEKEVNTLMERCKRVEISLLEKIADNGIIFYDRAKEQAEAELNSWKEKQKEFTNEEIVKNNIKLFEEYISNIEKQITTIKSDFENRSAQISNGKNISQIGKLKISKPPLLPKAEPLPLPKKKATPPKVVPATMINRQPINPMQNYGTPTRVLSSTNPTFTNNISEKSAFRPPASTYSKDVPSSSNNLIYSFSPINNTSYESKPSRSENSSITPIGVKPNNFKNVSDNSGSTSRNSSQIIKDDSNINEYSNDKPDNIWGVWNPLSSTHEITSIFHETPKKSKDNMAYDFPKDPFDFGISREPLSNIWTTEEDIEVSDLLKINTNYGTPSKDIVKGGQNVSYNSMYDGVRGETGMANNFSPYSNASSTNNYRRLPYGGPSNQSDNINTQDWYNNTMSWNTTTNRNIPSFQSKSATPQQGTASNHRYLPKSDSVSKVQQGQASSQQSQSSQQPTQYSSYNSQPDSGGSVINHTGIGKNSYNQGSQSTSNIWDWQSTNYTNTSNGSYQNSRRNY
uniref:MATH domain-containing protein n=1 Tax=Strongyloides venezuelensis TaxID=75913 RepID=A0A0K0FVQ7_STRVS